MSITHEDTAEQLPLLTVAEIPLQFRMDDRTRRIGLAGVANAKAILAEQTARRLERETTRHHGMKAAA
jgi:hypothetical protein